MLQRDLCDLVMLNAFPIAFYAFPSAAYGV